MCGGWQLHSTPAELAPAEDGGHSDDGLREHQVPRRLFRVFRERRLCFGSVYGVLGVFSVFWVCLACFGSVSSLESRFALGESTP